MKRILLLLLAISIISLTGCTKPNEQETTTNDNSTTESNSINEGENVTGTLLEVSDYFDNQTNIDNSLIQESKNDYSFEDPLIVVNPYGTAPLSAAVIFTTSDNTGVKITVKGKADKDNVTGTSVSATNHIVPIYGLYNGETTTVELTLDDGTTNTIEITTDLFAGLPDTEVTTENSDVYDYSNLTFASVMMSGGLLAYDSQGDVRWILKDTAAMPAKRLENGNLLVSSTTVLKTFYYTSGLIEVDLMGKVYNWYMMPGGHHHDFVELENGNLLMAGDRSDFETVEDYIIEIDRNTGEIVYELDMQDLIDPSDGSSPARTDHDWFHNNGVWYDKETDNILLSARHVDAVVAVNKTEKKISWILGDPDGWASVDKSYFFTPVGVNFEWQYLQHQVSILPNGNIMMFDNGGSRTKTTKPEQATTGDDIYSRVVVYDIDTDNMTIEQVWEYGKDRGPSWYSEWISGAVCLNNNADNIWITSGSNLYNPETNSYDYGPEDAFMPGLVFTTHINQVKDNDLVYELKINALTYRSVRLPMYTDTHSFDVTKAGKFLGNLGKTKTEDVTVDFNNIQEGESSWELTADKERLLFNGTYTTNEEEENQEDAYLVLKKADETVYSYKLDKTSAATDDGFLVTLSGWVSPVDLEGSSYDIYIMKDGATYSTGYSIQF